jgi:cytochrome c biogenesis protein CcdA
MDTLLTVIVLGLSVEGLVLCPFFAFGLSLTNRMAGLRFLLGRLIGLVCFGVVISLLGRTVHVDERITNLLFGLSIVVLGLIRSANLGETELGWKLLELKARLGLKKRCRGPGSRDRAGFWLGLFRGLCNPGRKYIYLAPFLLDLGVFRGLAVSFVYGISSSLYLLLGFISAGYINRLLPHKRRLSSVGGVILISLGSYYIWKSRTLL